MHALAGDVVLRDKKKLLSCFSSQRLCLASEQLHWTNSEYSAVAGTRGLSVVHFPD